MSRRSSLGEEAAYGLRRGLLASKLTIPRARPNLIVRPRLLARLKPDPARKLVLISAPAGFGKTTLLAAWIAGASTEYQAPSTESPAQDHASRITHHVSRITHFAWVSLDEGDDDPVRFWGHVIAALRTLADGVGEETLALLAASRPPALETLLAPLANDLEELPAAALVLDDYHCISSRDVHRGVAFLLEHLPAQVQLVIASRADPPLPLARLRARGEMLELRAADLRFTPAEAADFFRLGMGLDLAAGDVAALQAGTEGWAAGLQLAALSLQGQEDASAFVRAFAGSHRYVGDYLVEEVLQRQPPAVQSFLLQTSVLERLTGPLCDALTGQDDGQATLEMLERLNLFIFPLDGERRWFRYHHLFADLLRHRLRHSQPAAAPDLLHRAAAWYEQNDMPGEAARAALAAGDPDEAARLVESMAPALVRRSEMATLLTWLRALPEAAVRRRPRLCVHASWPLIINDRKAEAETLLAAAEQGMADLCVAEAEKEALRGEILAVRVSISAILSDTASVIALGPRALELLPPEQWFARGTVALNLAAAYRIIGDLATTRQLIRDYVPADMRERSLMLGVIAASNLGRVEIMEGRLRQAADYFQQAIEQASTRGGTPLPIASMAYTGLGEVHYLRGELDAAEQTLSTGIELSREWRAIEPLTEGYFTLWRVKRSQGDLPAALGALEQAELIVHENGLTRVAHHAAAVRARLMLATGNLDLAAAWLVRRLPELDADPAPSFERQREYMVAARVLHAQGRSADALRLLARNVALAEAANYRTQLIIILAAQAVTLQSMGSVEARGVLARALTLAEPERFSQIFLDEGPPMRRLLEEMVSRGPSTPFATDLLAAFGALDPAPPAPAAPDLIEQLTERELEILRLVAAGLSTQEVADHVFISQGTVRNHLKSIFGKLDAHSRLQAVERARALALI